MFCIKATGILPVDVVHSKSLQISSQNSVTRSNVDKIDDS